MSDTIRIGIIGDLNPAFKPHPATNASIQQAAAHLGITADIEWLPTDQLLDNHEELLQPFDGLWCSPGSPYKSMEGALNGIHFARTQNRPFIGTCAGFQHLVIEYARNVLNFKDATSAEYDPYASKLFISKLACSLAGQTMRVDLAAGTQAAVLYGQAQVEEHYYCNFGLNPTYKHLFENVDLCVSGRDQDGEIRILELPTCDFFVATLFVPQVNSTAEHPHPLITGFLQASLAFTKTRQPVS